MFCNEHLLLNTGCDSYIEVLQMNNKAFRNINILIKMCSQMFKFSHLVFGYVVEVIIADALCTIVSI